MVFFQFNFAQILLIFIWFALSMRVSVCTITRKETREHPSTKFNCNQQKSHKPWIPISNPQILWSRVIARLSVIQYHFLFPFLLLINPFISYHFCAWSLRFCKKKNSRKQHKCLYFTLKFMTDRTSSGFWFFVFSANENIRRCYYS